MKIGILRETKNPPDKRVPFTPAQCRQLKEDFGELELVVQPSDYRCYTDKEYIAEGIDLQEDISDCDVLAGVKEVKIAALIPQKTYIFFSHTAKQQPYNRELLQAIARKGITLLDYEYFTRKDKTRVVAFGRWAGIVGAYNGLKAYGERLGRYKLLSAGQLSGLVEMKKKVSSIKYGNLRIVLTGGGRVASGAVEVLKAAGIRELTAEDYLSGEYAEAVFCRLDPWHYARHIHGADFDFSHFVTHPDEYENAFLPYANQSDLYIACHFWDPSSPAFLSMEDLQQDDMRIRVIADISCDINGPIASTIRASTIAEPLYAYDPHTGSEVADTFSDKAITVMAVDNLPGELPRDASEDFGKALATNVIPSLLGSDDEGIIQRAMIVKNGELTVDYSYLENYLKG